MKKINVKKLASNVMAYSILWTTLAKIFGIKPEILLFGGAIETPQIIEPEEPKKTIEPVTLNQPPIIIDPPPPFIPTKNEENYIKILRTLKPEDRDEVIKFLELKYKHSK